MNDQANYRQQWADGEIEAGTLLDAIDSLQYANTQLAQKFGVAHQQAEALQADRDSWREQAEQRLEDWDRMRQERDGLRAELEAARGLLVGVVKRCSKDHGGSGYVGMDGQYLKSISAFLTTTPEPEARQEPGPDVRGLVEALRTVVGLLQHKATTPLEQEAVHMADKALTAHRQAQRKGESHDT